MEEKEWREKKSAGFWREEQGISAAPDWLPNCSTIIPSSFSSNTSSALQPCLKQVILPLELEMNQLDHVGRQKLHKGGKMGLGNGGPDHRLTTQEGTEQHLL